MKVQLNEDKEVVDMIKQGLRDRNGYCPCMLEDTPDTKCMCRDFRENVAVGELCHCGLFRKISV